MYRRRRRRLNRARFFTFLLVLAVIAGAVIYLIQGKLPFSRDNTVADATPGSTSTVPSATPKATPTPAPTPWPTPEPMPEESTDPAVLKVSWQTPAVFDGSNAFPDAASIFGAPDGSIKYWVLQNNKPVTDYQAQDNISFGSGQDYTSLEGVTAFRGNNYRDSASYGTRDVTEKKLEIVWTQDLGAISAEGSYWPGTGWTGQPLIVHWPEAEKNIMNINPDMKSKDLTEVIFPTLDGNIYFLDLETGKPTRDKIKVGFPLKGTGMVDPRGYPILYTGMGINENGGKYTEFKYMMFNLIDQTPLYSILGRDPMAFREWGAFDSSAVVDSKTDTFIEPAENGLVYKVKLNTNYNREAGTIAISPQITKFRYDDPANPEQGIENSAAYYKNYMYSSDNGGTFICLDLNTMKPVWVYHLGDDTDTSTVIEETSDGVFLYTANEIDKRSQNNQSPTAPCNIRKFNALTGELIWQKDYECYYQFYINGGSLGTPILGKNDINDLVIFPICFTGSTTDGKLVALNKKTGEEVWSRNLSAYSWSSPVDFLSSDGKTYAVFCDFAGQMHLFDPRTGKDLDVISLGRNIESSPAVYNDMIVVGSYAPKIFGIKIK